MNCDCCRISNVDHSHNGYKYCAPCFVRCEAIHHRKSVGSVYGCRVQSTYRCDCCSDMVSQGSVVRYGNWAVCQTCYSGCPSQHSFPTPIECKRVIITDEQFEAFRQKVITSLATGSQPVVRSSDHILRFAQKILNHPR